MMRMRRKGNNYNKSSGNAGEEFKIHALGVEGKDQ